MDRSAEITITPNDDGSFAVMATDVIYGGKTGLAIRLSNLAHLLLWLRVRFQQKTLAPAEGG